MCVISAESAADIQIINAFYGFSSGKVSGF